LNGKKAAFIGMNLIFDLKCIFKKSLFSYHHTSGSDLLLKQCTKTPTKEAIGTVSLMF
jgi:hypothetical protein